MCCKYDGCNKDVDSATMTAKQYEAHLLKQILGKETDIFSTQPNRREGQPETDFLIASLLSSQGTEVKPGQSQLGFESSDDDAIVVNRLQGFDSQSLSSIFNNLLFLRNAADQLYGEQLKKSSSVSPTTFFKTVLRSTEKPLQPLTQLHCDNCSSANLNVVLPSTTLLLVVVAFYVL